MIVYRLNFTTFLSFKELQGSLFFYWFMAISVVKVNTFLWFLLLLFSLIQSSDLILMTLFWWYHKHTSFFWDYILVGVYASIWMCMILRTLLVERDVFLVYQTKDYFMKRLVLWVLIKVHTSINSRHLYFNYYNLYDWCFCMKYKEALLTRRQPNPKLASLGWDFLLQ